MTEDRTLVIGGGIIGLTIAHALAVRGRTVTLLDAGQPARGVSQGNAGQISPGHPPIPSPGIPGRTLELLLDHRSPLYIPPRPSIPLLRWLLDFRRACRPAWYAHSMETLGAMSRLSRTGFDALHDELGVAATLDPAGVADLWSTSRGESDAHEETRWLERLGMAVEYLDGPALRQRDPAWRPAVRGAFIHQDGMTVDPSSLIAALRARIAALGGVLGQSSQVVDLVGGDPWHAHLADGETVPATSIVLAAGVWTDLLARRLGVRISLQGAKGYHRMMQSPRLPSIAGVLREPKIAITPMHGAIRVAGTLELSGLNHRVVTARLNQLKTGAGQFLGDLQDVPGTAPWCGLRPCTADGLPIVGRVPGVPRAWIATGHGMMGLTLAPATATLIVDDICGAPLPTWARAVDVQRSGSIRSV